MAKTLNDTSVSQPDDCDFQGTGREHYNLHAILSELHPLLNDLEIRVIHMGKRQNGFAVLCRYAKPNHQAVGPATE